MPDTTPTYGWPFPVGTDRVADGDNAMQDLAEAIESTLADIIANGTTTTAVSYGANVAPSLGGATITRLGPLAVFRFNFDVTGGIAANSSLGVVPTGWRPATTVHGTQSIATVGTVVGIHLDGDGNIRNETVLSASAQHLATFVYAIA